MVSLETTMILKTKFISLHGFAYTGVLLFCSIMKKNLLYIVILSILHCILILLEFSKKNKSKNMRNYIYYDDFISVASIVPILWLYSKGLEQNNIFDDIYIIFLLCALIILISLLSFIKNIPNNKE